MFIKATPLVNLMPSQSSKLLLIKENRCEIRKVCHCLWFSNTSLHQNHLGDLLKHRLLGPSPRVSESIALELDPTTYTSSQVMCRWFSVGPHSKNLIRVSDLKRALGKQITLMY